MASRVDNMGMFRRQARVSRRTGDLKLADQVTTAILDRVPQDRRALAVRAWIAGKQGNPRQAELWLAGLAQAAETKGFLRDRNRVALRRAFSKSQRGEGALADFQTWLGQATAGDDKYAVFMLRQGIVSVHARAGNLTELEPALAAYLGAARAAGYEAHALALLSELARGRSGGASLAARLLLRRCLANSEMNSAIGWYRELGRSDPATASAAGAEGKALETLFTTRALWADLAELYRVQAEQSTGAVAAQRLAQLAELLEDELGRPADAAKAYGEAAAAGLASAAAEQARLLAEHH